MLFNIAMTRDIEDALYIFDNLRPCLEAIVEYNIEDRLRYQSTT